MFKSFLSFEKNIVELFNKLSPNGATVPVLAMSGGKTMRSPLNSLGNFVDYTDPGAVKTAEERKYEEKMYELAKGATIRTNRDIENEIERRMRSGEIEPDRTFGEEKLSSSDILESEPMTRKIEKWTDVDRQSEGKQFQTFENREGRVKELLEKVKRKMGI